MLGKPSTVAAAFVVGSLIGGAALLASTEAKAQFPIPMIPNFNFGGPHYYHSAPSRSYRGNGNSGNTSTNKPKPEEKDATQEEAAATASAQQKQTSAPQSNAAPSGGGTGGPATPPPPPAKKPTDDAPAFAPSR